MEARQKTIEVAHILIMGTGNPIRGDDGSGVEIVCRIKARREPAAFEYLEGGSSGLDLLPHRQDRSHVLVVDAVDSEGFPGQRIRLRADEIPGGVGLKLSGHPVTFPEVPALLELAGAGPANQGVLGVQPARPAVG